MRIAFVHDWEPDLEQEATWCDGLYAALIELKRRGHEVGIFTVGKERFVLHREMLSIVFTNEMERDVVEYNPDVILFWADMTRPHEKILAKLGKPMAICFAGGDTNTENTPLFDHIFVESEVYRKKLEDTGFSVSIAFGTNTRLFRPAYVPKMFDTIFPATFAAWKRHNLYAEATEGLNSIAVGYMYQDHETECWKDCIKRGIMVLPHVSAEALMFLYAASRACVVTSMSSGGSQRTVLEAMAMNLPLIVTDSDKFDYVRDRDDVWQVEPDARVIRETVDFILNNRIKVNTRDYVLENWSEVTYADSLEKGLRSIL